MTASAACISSFGRTTNDGVFTLTSAQAAFLGTPTADRIGFFRVRALGSPSVTFNSANTVDGELFRAIAFTFNSASGSIVFRGSATFNPALTSGVSDVPTAPPVPLPAAAWLLLSGLAGLGVLGRRRTTA